jgi:hypothetical protein
MDRDDLRSIDVDLTEGETQRSRASCARTLFATPERAEFE